MVATPAPNAVLTATGAPLTVVTLGVLAMPGAPVSQTTSAVTSRAKAG